jgi:hypothetical protein
VEKIQFLCNALIVMLMPFLIAPGSPNTVTLPFSVIFAAELSMKVPIHPSPENQNNQTPENKGSPFLQTPSLP